MPFADVDRSEEDNACCVVGKLREEFDFEVRDYNLEDKNFFENLYAQIFTSYSLLHKKYKWLKTDYNLLKGCYVDLMAKKDRNIVECHEMKENICKCIELLSPRCDGATAVPGNGTVSKENLETPLGYRE